MRTKMPVTETEAGDRMVGEARTTMGRMLESIRRVGGIMGEIKMASGEQSAGVSQICEAVSQMDEMTQRNAALVEEVAAAATGLEQQASKLSQAVSVFKLPTAFATLSASPTAWVLQMPV